MVAACVLIDVGRATKLRGQHNERRVEHSTISKIYKQPTHAGIEVRRLLTDTPRSPSGTPPPAGS